jgi:hypothetical protein
MSDEAKGCNVEEEFSESRRLILQMAATLMASRTADKLMNLDEQSKALRAASQMIIATKPSKYIYLHNLFTPEQSLPSNKIAKTVRDNKWAKMNSKTSVDNLLESVRVYLDTGESTHAVDIGLTYICRNLQLDKDSSDEIAAIRKSLLYLNKRIYIPSTNQTHTSDTHTTESVSSESHARKV